MDVFLKDDLAINIVLTLLLFIASYILPKMMRPMYGNTKNEHQKLMVEKIFRYIFFIISFFFALQFFDIDLKVILGAAGIFSVAIGFASQTSASNLISGLFLLIERPFKAGDTIIVGEIKGVVLSMDLLSTRLRTLDNMLVRIPNESLMKSNLINMTHFPIRRVDIKLPLEFGSNLDLVEKILIDIASEIAESLDEPKPVFVVDGIVEHSLMVQFSFWCRVENISSVKKKVYTRMLNKFENSKITIAIPKRMMVSETVDNG